MKKTINKDDIEDPDASRDSMASNPTTEERDFIVTGGVDDCVKVWEYENDKMKLRNTLTGHSLGVVSVDVSSDGESKLTVKIEKCIFLGNLRLDERAT